MMSIKLEFIDPFWTLGGPHFGTLGGPHFGTLGGPHFGTNLQVKLFPTSNIR
jgi:hypothetical protein